MKKYFLFFLMLSLFIGCSRKPSGPVQLVVDGETTYTISIPEEPSDGELRAAEFLRDHILKITGCEIPMVCTNEQGEENSVIITQSEEMVKGDAFSIQTQGSNLIIQGGNARGCVYGVGEVLEKFLGVRYYSPQYVVIPETKNVILPEINIQDASSNTYRNVNGQFTADPDYRDFNRLHTIDDMFARGYYVHTFHRLIPWQEYFAQNPEYFAFMNGKRIIDQLCLSNPEVFDLVVEKLGKEMALQPEKQVWSVSQDDNFSYCQCEDCSKVIAEEGSPAGPIIHFVNRVADTFPDKVISTLAYQYSRQAPVKTRPRDNVQVMLCTIELNRSQPIATDPSSVSFLKDLEDWGKITNHIYLWDYTVDFAHQTSPFPNLHILQPNIQLFVNNNVSEHFQQTNTGVGHEFSELKAWLISKLLWNPNADVEAIIEEFTDGFYGPAGKWIRKYIYALEREIKKTGEWLDIYGPPTNYQHTFLSAALIEEYNGYFDRAEKAVAKDPEYLLHVQTARMPLQYAMMEIGKNDMFGERGWYREVEGDFVPRPEMVDRLEAFYQTSQQAQISNINESGLTPQAYYESTKRFIDVQVEGNLAFRRPVTADPLPAEKYSGGDLSFLTNGVRGANDYKVHWLGWEGKDFSLVLDLEELVNASQIEISTLWDPKSWILHPVSVTCHVSADGEDYATIDLIEVTGDQRQEPVNRLFAFDAPEEKFRYVKFEIKGPLRLFDWHPSAGGGAWVFMDEVVVK